MAKKATKAAAAVPTRAAVKTAMIKVLKEGGHTTPHTAMFVDDLLEALLLRFSPDAKRLVGRFLFSLLAASHSEEEDSFGFTQLDLVYLATA